MNLKFKLKRDSFQIFSLGGLHERVIFSCAVYGGGWVLVIHIFIDCLGASIFGKSLFVLKNKENFRKLIFIYSEFFFSKSFFVLNYKSSQIILNRLLKQSKNSATWRQKQQHYLVLNFSWKKAAPTTLLTCSWNEWILLYLFEIQLVFWVLWDALRECIQNSNRHPLVESLSMPLNHISLCMNKLPVILFRFKYLHISNT